MTRSEPNRIQRFLKQESAPGVLLVVAGILALILANTPLHHVVQRAWDTHLVVSLGALGLDKPLLLWINDGLMAVFFLLVGLEIKREIMGGELSDPRTLALPTFGAAGGMIVPALVYFALNRGDEAALRGWAIPAATDIAFAIGVLTLFGDRVPTGLKAFLLTLAILDDLGAIVIIALFYSHGLSVPGLVLAVFALVALFLMNRAGVVSVAAYLLVGLVLWVCVLKSGVHATLAGVATALAVPFRTPFTSDRSVSPLLSLEHALQPWVVRGILPIFALANAGVRLVGLPPETLLESVPLGITLGLVLGKLVGVFSASALAVFSGLGRLPERVTWSQLFGASLLCGVGFTMSLFIASLAFGEGGGGLATTSRLGILFGSLVAAVAGWLWLRVALPKTPFTAVGREPGDFLTGA